MATLAPRGRIDEATVEEELQRLRRAWGGDNGGRGEDVLAEILDEERLAAIDLFDRVQLAGVVKVCRREPSLSAAGRRLFAISRTKKASSNDADRLRKYLERFGLDWNGVQAPRA
jgi:transcriptional regulatory protein RtcR